MAQLIVSFCVPYLAPQRQLHHVSTCAIALIRNCDVGVPAAVKFQINRTATVKAVIVKCFVGDVGLVFPVAPTLTMQVCRLEAVKLRLSSTAAGKFADRGSLRKIP